MTDVKITERTDYRNNWISVLEGAVAWNVCDLPSS